MIPAAPISWPAGYRAAASFSFDLDAESAVLAQEPKAVARMSVMSHQAYGPLVGVPRILNLLERQGIRSTFFVPGYSAERWPDVVRAIVDAGHEIAHHGYLHEPPTRYDATLQAEHLDRGLEALDRIAGTRPVGYRAPWWELSWDSPRLLAERGFLYDTSLMDADVPYELATGASPLVELPIQWALDDWEQYCFLPDLSPGVIETPAKARELWSGELGALREAGGIFVLTCHPFLSGRPSRAASLERLIEEAVGFGDVWVAPLGDIAAHVRSLGLAERTIRVPNLAGTPLSM
jgi:peptidoglycan/xylan/chitin deacetylase (PgdA/CDA1 family)